MKKIDDIQIIARPANNPFGIKRISIFFIGYGIIPGDEPSFNVFKSCPGGDYPDVPIFCISAVGVRRSVRRFFRGCIWDESKLDEFLEQF